MSAQRERFEKLLAAGQDNALLRFALAGALTGDGRWLEAIAHLEEALRQDPAYSAAWKLLSRALLEAGQPERVLEVCAQGILVARQRGDLQAVKEMEVFSRRAQKQRAAALKADGAAVEGGDASDVAHAGAGAGADIDIDIDIDADAGSADPKAAARKGIARGDGGDV